MTLLDKRATLPPSPSPCAFVEIRGADGRLYGRIDLARLIFEGKKGARVETIDLKRLEKHDG